MVNARYDIYQSVWYVLTNLILIAILWGLQFYPHFVDKETHFVDKETMYGEIK